MESNKKVKIVCVIVTYNRLEKLRKCLSCYENQSICPSEIIIVNNNSSDGTKEFLEQWKCLDSSIKKTVINLESNQGGAGGFSCGIREALEREVDYIFICDDDGYPEKKMFENLQNKINIFGDKYFGYCTKVIYPSGEIQLSHRRNIFKNKIDIKDISSKESDYFKDFEINTFSFVGALLKKESVIETGLPISDFFIWYDDTEYSIRFSKNNKVICVVDAIIIHDVEKTVQSINWKTYYGIRNRLLLIKMHFGYIRFLFNFIKVFLGSFRLKNREHKLLNRIKRNASLDAFFNRKGKNKKYLP